MADTTPATVYAICEISNFENINNGCVGMMPHGYCADGREKAVEIAKARLLAELEKRSKWNSFYQQLVFHVQHQTDKSAGIYDYGTFFPDEGPFDRISAVGTGEFSQEYVQRKLNFARVPTSDTVVVHAFEVVDQLATTPDNLQEKWFLRIAYLAGAIDHVGRYVDDADFNGRRHGNTVVTIPEAEIWQLRDSYLQQPPQPPATFPSSLETLEAQTQLFNRLIGKRNEHIIDTQFFVFPLEAIADSVVDV